MMTVREASSAEVAGWDEIVRRFPNHRLPQTRPWIEALAASGCGEPLFLVLETEAGLAGCLPGLTRTMAGGRLRLFGSPLAGWQTVSLGPAFDPAAFSTADFAAALPAYLAEDHGIDYIELLHHGLDAAAMRDAGFTGEAVYTCRAPLVPGDPARTLKQLKDSARRNVRRAERLGLEVRFETDERFVDEHYAQLREVYRRGGYSVPFPKARVLAVFRRLRDAGNLLALSVSLPGGGVPIATGMFFVGGRELLLWMWAHRERYRWYRPTELMTWTAMRRAVELGCDSFDLMGRGDFKAKFGAQPDGSKMRWQWGRRPWLLPARRLAERGYRAQQAVRGRTARIGRSALAHLRRTARADALVLGDIDLVRALGLAGVRSAVLAPPHSPARYSRHVRAALPWHDAWERPEELVESLVAFGQAQPEPPALFYQEDRTLLLVSRYRERLAQAFRFVVPDAELVEQLVDKARFQELAARLALPVPPARLIRPGEEPPPTADDFPLAFPIVLKPVTRRPSRWEPVAGAGKARAVAGLTELRALWPRLAAAQLPVIAQQLIPGAEHLIESYHVYVDGRGAIAGEFTGRKIRTWPPAYGDSSALETTAASDVLELGRALVARLALRGVAKLDFKRGAGGALHLLEVNPRFNLWHHLGAAAGINLPALVCADLTGRARPAAAMARPGVHWCKPWKDAPAARAVGMSLATWLAWAWRCEAKSGAAWDDPLPLLGASLRRGLIAVRHRIAPRELPLPLHVPTRSDV
ncbi:MAG: GNAT family N-acetyltransferase [Gemmatimonadales bacterium]